MKAQFSYTLTALSAALLLSACGGGSGGSSDDRILVELNSAEVSLEPLQKTAANSFARHFKNGLYTASINQYVSCTQCADDVVTSSAPDAAEGNFSSTNTQEAGVDEADRIKYDGQYMYLAAKPWYDLDQSDPGAKEYVKIMQRQADTSMVEVGKAELPADMTYVNGLYLYEEKLAAIGNPNFYFGGPEIAFDIWHPVNLKVNLAVYDVQSPQSPELNQFLSYDGYLISSRRIDNKLYLVSSFSPTVEGLNYGASSDDEKQANYDKLQAMNINELMPKLTLPDNSVRNLVEPEDCYIPEDATNADGYDAIVTLTTVDLSQPANVQSVCINALTHGIYASTNAVYLLGTTNNAESVVHKFAFEQGLNYVGAGNLDGMFGWRAPSFRLSEHQGRLRAVTTKWTEQGPVHQLFVLDAEPQNKKLNVISQLPNELRPDAIGKPNEDIYAVRFINDKAYVVTYERIDPLYVLDLADDNDPKIAGALEIPGYSAYLHPLSDNLLLGVGQQIDPNNLPQNGGTNTASSNPIAEGAKVSLFDVSDPANPQEIGGVVYDNGYTPVEWDHHALTYLQVSDSEYRFALPVNYWQRSSDTSWSSINALQTLQVNVTENGAELVEHPPIVAEVDDQMNYISGSDDRSVLHDDVIYYIHGNEVIRAIWGE